MQSIDIICSSGNEILPNDKATTDACLSYLKLKKIGHVVRSLRNAGSASPDGLLPVSNINGHLVSGFMTMCYTYKTLTKKTEVDMDPVVLETKNMHHIFFSWMCDVLRNLTMYLTWVEPTGERRTLDMFGKMYPWPLSRLYFERQKKLSLKFLTAIGLASEECADVLKRFDDACKHIVSMLSDGPFMFGRKKAGKIDCLLAAYVNLFLTNPDYFSLLTPTLAKYPSLSKHAATVHSS